LTVDPVFSNSNNVQTARVEGSLARYVRYCCMLCGALYPVRPCELIVESWKSVYSIPVIVHVQRMCID
jgi:hypothetical protein